MDIFLEASGDVVVSEGERYTTKRYPYCGCVTNEVYVKGLVWDEGGLCYEGGETLVPEHNMVRMLTTKEAADVIEKNIQKGFYKDGREYLAEWRLERLQA